MSKETIIENIELAIFSVVGDDIGKCEGKITGYSMGGISVQVQPDPKLCNNCEFKRECLDSKAD